MGEKMSSQVLGDATKIRQMFSGCEVTRGGQEDNFFFWLPFPEKKVFFRVSFPQATEKKLLTMTLCSFFLLSGKGGDDN